MKPPSARPHKSITRVEIFPVNKFVYILYKILNILVILVIDEKNMRSEVDFASGVHQLSSLFLLLLLFTLNYLMTYSVYKYCENIRVISEELRNKIVTVYMVWNL
jgi:hypothetical protein